jgi:hypothetical protein
MRRAESRPFPEGRGSDQRVHAYSSLFLRFLSTDLSFRVGAPYERATIHHDCPLPATGMRIKRGGSVTVRRMITLSSGKAPY